MNICSLAEDPTATAEDVHVVTELCWREWVTIRRIRMDLTKQELAMRVGCSRTTLWRGLECKPTHARFLEFGPDMVARIERALTDRQAELVAARLAA